jgi:hypothetical protein
VLNQGLQVLFHIVMAKFPIPEYCSAYVPMILKAFCSSKINGLVMKTFSWKYDIMIDSCTYIYIYIYIYIQVSVRDITLECLQKLLQNLGDQHFLVICITTYGVLTTYQVS